MRQILSTMPTAPRPAYRPTTTELRDVRAYGARADLVRYRTEHAYRAAVRRVVATNFYLMNGSFPTWLLS